MGHHWKCRLLSLAFALALLPACRGARHALPGQAAAQPASSSSSAAAVDNAAGAAASQYLPVVLWHGMGDSCCASYSIGAVRDRIQQALPGVYVHSIATGTSTDLDTVSGFFGNVNDQVAQVCERLTSIPQLQGGYNAVGFSQGGQFMRAVVQRCQAAGPRARTLVTLGGQHQGVMNAPECWNPSYNATPSPVCGAVQALLAAGAYLPWIRDHVVQAQYFKDPYHLDRYLTHNPFLPDVNNERPAKNATYAVNLASLTRLVLGRFRDDVTVVPRDSAWFSFYDGARLVPLREQLIYQEDWIGLRALDELGRLELLDVPGLHMHFTLDWFETHIVRAYLATPPDQATSAPAAAAAAPQRPGAVAGGKSGGAARGDNGAGAGLHTARPAGTHDEGHGARQVSSGRRGNDGADGDWAAAAEWLRSGSLYS